MMSSLWGRGYINLCIGVIVAAKTNLYHFQTTIFSKLYIKAQYNTYVTLGILRGNWRMFIRTPSVLRFYSNLSHTL